MRPMVAARTDPLSRLGPGGVLGCLAGAGLMVGVGASLGLAPGVAALAAASVGLVLLQRPTAAALLLVTLVPVVSGFRRGLPVPGLRLSELLVGAVGVVVLATAPAQRSACWRLFDWLALVYVLAHAALGIADTLARDAPLDFQRLGEVLGPLQFFLLYRAVLVALPTDEHRRKALRLVLLAAIPVALIALLQQLGVGGVRNALSAVTTEAGADHFANSLDNGVARASGPFPAWHALGGYLCLVLLLATGLLLDGSPPTILRRRVLLLVVVAAGAGIAATASLAPIFAAVAGAVMLGWWSRRLGSTVGGLLVVGLLAAILFAPQFTDRFDQQYRSASASGFVPQTISFRYDVWTEQVLPVLSGHWITGVGTDSPADASWKSTESIYFTMLLRGGIPLLAAYLALIGFLVVEALGATRGGPSARRALARVVVVAVVMLSIIQIFNPLLVGVGVPHLLWVLIALLFGMRESASDARETPPSDRCWIDAGDDDDPGLGEARRVLAVSDSEWAGRGRHAP
jgi:O-Antigen ligase